MANLNNDIEKYLRGDLSPAEMHALEQKALQDPFLAEALEGAEHAAPEEFSIDLQMIRQSLTEKTRTKRRFIDINGWQWYTGIAAGLLMLVLCTYTVIMMINQQRPKENLALSEQEPETTDSIVKITPGIAAQTQKDGAETDVQDDSQSVVSSEPQKQITKAEEKKRDIRERNDLAMNDRAKSRKTTEPEGLSRAGEVAVEKPGVAVDTARVEPLGYASEIAESPVIESRDETKTEDVAISKRDVDGGVADKDVDVPAALRGKTAGVTTESRKFKAEAGADLSGRGETLIRGKVTDGNDPIPGVNVIVKGTTLGTVTDVKGEYMITIPAGSHSLVFNFIGLEAEEVPVSEASNDRMDVVMEQDATALSEVVVTAYGSQTPDRTHSTFEMAEPDGGRRAFNRYIEDNVKYPQQARDHKVEGRVTIEFTVGIDGRLSDFKVIRGIGSGCDEELIRVIQNGPKWSPSSSDGKPFVDKVRVRYRFDLP